MVMHKEIIRHNITTEAAQTIVCDNVFESEILEVGSNGFNIWIDVLETKSPIPFTPKILEIGVCVAGDQILPGRPMKFVGSFTLTDNQYYVFEV